MKSSETLVNVWRGPLIENQHRGHAVICDGRGEILEAWGNPEAVIYPRSSCKMIQALPLVESGCADAYGLTDAQLALSCASHQGAEIHSRPVQDWLTTIGLGESDLRCGVQTPNDIPARDALILAGETPCQLHNNCSGKHAGFLTLTQHMKAGPEYVEVDHPLQRVIKDAFESATDETSPCFGIDGCSAPNHATSVHGLARAMGRFAAARDGVGDKRQQAMARLARAMAQYPELVAGEGRACTNLMRAMDHKVAVKTGAEAVFIAIIPELDRGIALKIEDGTTKAAECVITSLLVRLGVLDANHPVARQYMYGPISNWRGINTGHYEPISGLI